MKVISSCNILFHQQNIGLTPSKILHKSLPKSNHSGRKPVVSKKNDNIKNNNKVISHTDSSKVLNDRFSILNININYFLFINLLIIESIVIEEKIQGIF